MAHTRPILERTCQICKKKATVEVYNIRNAPYEYYCTKHGNDSAKELTKEGS